MCTAMQFNTKLRSIFWKSLSVPKCFKKLSLWKSVTIATPEFCALFPHLYFLSPCALALAALPFTDRHGMRNKRPAAESCQKCIKSLHRLRFHISPAIWAPWNWTFSSVERVSDSSRAESKQPPARGSHRVARINGHHRMRLPAVLLDLLPTLQEKETWVKPTTVSV